MGELFRLVNYSNLPRCIVICLKLCKWELYRVVHFFLIVRVLCFHPWVRFGWTSRDSRNSLYRYSYLYSHGVLATWCSRDPQNGLQPKTQSRHTGHSDSFCQVPRCFSEVWSCWVVFAFHFFRVSVVFAMDIPPWFARWDHSQHIPCSSIHKLPVACWRRYPKTTLSNVYLDNAEQWWCQVDDGGAKRHVNHIH